jgi:uncharacterized protein (DUF58 family)
MKEIKVDLLPLIRKLEAVQKRGFSRETMVGSYQSVFRGKGMEFVGFREYVPSDDAMLIDWKASLKANKLMVRLLEEERNLTILFMVNVSDSMLFSSHTKLKCEYAAELVGTLCYAMSAVGDSVGLCMFNDKIIKLIQPAVGRDQFYKIAMALTNPSLYGGKVDFNHVISSILSLGSIKRDTIIFIISDFLGLKEGWEEQLKLAGLKYDLSAFIIRDPVDMRLPEIEGEVAFADPYSGKQLLVSPLEAKRRYDEEAKSQISRLKANLMKTNSNMLLLETDKPFTKEIYNYFRMRKRFK